MAPLTDPQAEKLRRIHNIPALVQYLHDELGWPIEATDWEDLVFDWQPEELNLKPEHQVKIRAIKQLRPLVTGQPWGIFFVDFDKGDLPITVLRRVLNGLVPKGRAKGGGHQTWHARDLLFVSTFGAGTPSHPREIALAHFTDESDVGDLPTLRVLGWDAEDTPLQLADVARTLKEKLRWPQGTSTKADQDAWRIQWASAFRLTKGQVVNDSKTLAITLAELAKRIRSRVNTVLELESERGHLRQLHKAFKDNLIADLSDDGFADMFAQTITYGLFAARASRGSGALVADDAALMAPNTNPFLKELLQDFLHAGGRAKRGLKRVDFDELGINDVVATLRDVPMDDVLRSFNAAKPGDDPVIHFYELFLKEYDKKLRAKRGVFYTPRPVVQFIVRSVDEILKTEFGIEDGLASTITWGEMLQRRPELKLPQYCTPQTPFVQILDPATGTATFIVEVIEHVHAHMVGVWRKQGLVKREQWLPKWHDYVRLNLLPRLYAFELMMAPYAIAHMKIGIKLAETGYAFPDNGPRVQVFLANALEPAHPIQAVLEELAPMLAHEANAANSVKAALAATVILGNPPYAGHSANNNVPSIVSAVHDYKRGYADLQKPGQAKWLQNDYVKFIRFAEQRILQTGVGVLGYITDHSYLDNPTFKGMRRHLRNSFPYLRIVDLHGNSKKKEKAADGSKDESVFGITQGTAIGLFAKGARHSGEQSLDILGSEGFKADAMLRTSLLREALTPLEPNEPFWLFKPQAQAARSDYENGWGLPLIFSPNGDPAPGIVTTHDEFAISWNATDAVAKVRALLATADEAEARNIFQLCTQDQWNYGDAKKALSDGAWKKMIVPVLYRPFDIRTTVYDSHVAVHRRQRVTAHFLAGKNLGISCTRAVEIQGPFQHVFCTSLMTQHHTVSIKEVNYLFPIWRYLDAGREENLLSSYVQSLLSALGLASSDYRAEDPTAPLHAEKIFHYIYAVLHSPAYRQRYAAFLRTDFPRIPIPGSHGVFDALATLGAELVAWHLLEHPAATEIVAGGAQSARAPAWFGTDFFLAKVAEKSRELADVQGNADKVGRVFVNATSGFANVRQAVWQHTIGGYQVLHKWLDDRRKADRSLSQDDVTHWLRVYAALEATQQLMLQVDVAIEANGGWPDAFSQNHPPPDAATLAAEQQKLKDQLKAQKKLAGATKKRAANASPTGATSLFDDLEDLANAAGEPPRPKARATPAAAAAGGIDAVTDWQAMCAIRAVLARAGSLPRPALTTQVARELGFARVGPRIAKVLDDAIRRAVRRGIAEPHASEISLLAREIDGYAIPHLKTQLLAVLRARATWAERAEVPRLLARWMGYARTGGVIVKTVESLVRSLVRSKALEAKEGKVRAVR